MSKLIMLVQKTKYSHHALGYISETGRLKVCDSTNKTVRDRLSDQFFDDYELIEVKTREFDIERKEFLSWFEKIEGIKYDNLQILGLLMKALGFVTFNKIGHNFKRMTCNEVILSFLTRFDKLKVEDSDNFDLNMTWDLING